MQRQPRVVWIFVAYELLRVVVGLVIWPPPVNAGAITAIIISTVFVLLVFYWFIRGLRAAWWLLVIVGAFFLIPMPLRPISASFWFGELSELVSLGLLVSPSMRRYFFQRDVPAEA